MNVGSEDILQVTLQKVTYTLRLIKNSRVPGEDMIFDQGTERKRSRSCHYKTSRSL